VCRRRRELDCLTHEAMLATCVKCKTISYGTI
jgi:hypothetical protein